MALIIGDIFSESAAAARCYFGASATRYRTPEYVRVISVVVTECKFRDARWQIFATEKPQ
jgi:hypothetical protein